MNIEIVCAGRSLQAHEQAWIDDYLVRAKKYARVKLVRVKEQTTPEATWKKMEAAINPSSWIVVLDPTGKNTTTEQLKSIFEKAEFEKKGALTFVIGGSYGLPEAAKKRANSLVSFGALTLPHRVVLLILTEQIYRVLSWKAGSPYHHA